MDNMIYHDDFFLTSSFALLFFILYIHFESNSSSCNLILDKISFRKWVYYLKKKKQPTKKLKCFRIGIQWTKRIHDSYFGFCVCALLFHGLSQLNKNYFYLHYYSWFSFNFIYFFFSFSKFGNLFAHCFLHYCETKNY